MLSRAEQLAQLVVQAGERANARSLYKAASFLMKMLFFNENDRFKDYPL
jgi:hypothetical protein